MKSFGAAVASFLVLIAGVTSLTTGEPAARHLALSRAEPPADSTVTTAPKELRLFWTEPPQLPATAIRLTNAANERISVGQPKADSADAKIISVEIVDPLAPGTYTVTWRTAGNDGHVLTGNYKFTYRPAD